jgi:hypothetical protein
MFDTQLFSNFYVLISFEKRYAISISSSIFSNSDNTSSQSAQSSVEFEKIIHKNPRKQKRDPEIWAEYVP